MGRTSRQGTGRKIYKSCGVQTGLGITGFFCSLFQANELNPRSKKLTDDDIEMRVRKEFPGRPLWKNFGKGKRYTVSTYRAKYNKGELTRGIPPATFSFRYDFRGLIVESRFGRRVLLEEEIRRFKEAQSTLHHSVLRKLKAS